MRAKDLATVWVFACVIAILAILKVNIYMMAFASILFSVMGLLAIIKMGEVS